MRRARWVPAVSALAWLGGIGNRREIRSDHEPAAAARARDLQGHDQGAPLRALQLDSESDAIVPLGHGEGTFDDAIPDVVQIDLEDREPLLDVVGLHAIRGETTLASPERAHPLEVVRLHGRHELGERLLGGLRRNLAGPLAPAREGAQRDEHGQSWSHERFLECGGVIRR